MSTIYAVYTLEGDPDKSVLVEAETLEDACLLGAILLELDDISDAYASEQLAPFNKPVYALRTEGRDAEIRDVINAVAEGGWGTSNPDDKGPTLTDAARVIREFHRFREEVWNQAEVTHRVALENAFREGFRNGKGLPHEFTEPHAAWMTSDTRARLEAGNE